MSLKLPTNFRIPLVVERHTQFQKNKLGAHDQYFVYAYDLQIGSFLEPKSAFEYQKFLIESNFKPFRESPEGLKILEILYESFLNDPLNKVEKDVAGIVLNDLKNRKSDA